jgi:N utilization substance protein A
MSNILSQTIEQISKEKGIGPEIIQHALEEAMVAAAKKYFRNNEDLQARYDPETGTIDVFAVKQIVEQVEDADTQMSLEEALEVDESFQVGEFVEIPKPTSELGRIAAQTAKQVIFQKVREAERDIVYGEFSGQVGHLVNGIVRRFEGRNIILDIGKTEAILPGDQQCRNEQYKQGDRVRAVILEVNRNAKGPQIRVSRNDPSLLMRLFEMEIPEVYDSTVVIRGAVREGGERAKVAVVSRDDAIDPVGACVGMKGTRINAVIRELKGEKIDIIEYSDDIVEFTTNALSPARISRVLVMDGPDRVLEVIVPDDQLSLAIGKKGQNVRLASKLVGWQINIKSEEAKKQEILSQMDRLTAAPTGDPLSALEGLGEKTLGRLEEAGVASIQDLAERSMEDLVALPGIGEKTAQRLLAQAQAFLSGEPVGASAPEETGKADEPLTQDEKEVVE